MGLSKYNIGLLQLAFSENVEDNLKKAAHWLEQAVKRGAQIICLPELYISLYLAQKEDFDNFNLAEKVPGPSTNMF